MSKKYGLIDLKSEKVSLDPNHPVSKTTKEILSEEAKDEYSYSKEKYDLHKKRNLEADDSIYLYDEIYDDLKKSQKEKEQIAKVAKANKPKYIDAIMHSARLRQIETERRNESMINREREKEGNLFDDKETFITNTYKSKIEESIIRKEIDKKIDAIEEKESSSHDFTNFYSNIYKQTFQGPESFQESGKSIFNLREQQEKIVKEYMDRKATLEDTNTTTPEVKPHINAKEKTNNFKTENKDERHYRKQKQDDDKHARDISQRSQSKERKNHREERSKKHDKANDRGNDAKHERYEKGDRRRSRSREGKDRHRHNPEKSHGPKEERKHKHEDRRPVRSRRREVEPLQFTGEEEREREREKEIVVERLAIFARRNLDSDQLTGALERYLTRLAASDARGGLDVGFEPADRSWRLPYEIVQELFRRENI